MQENIPAGLQALMQASSVLQQTASPVAPGPQGEQPTVAGRIMQQMPGMAQAGRQAGIANAMLMQRLQQRQQAAQDPEMIARMAAQMMRQGVAGLPAPMQFKDGGIIGFQSRGLVESEFPGYGEVQELTPEEARSQEIRGNPALLRAAQESMTLPELQQFNRSGEIPARLLFPALV